jgi:uncharacterized protein YdaU (DUF1376 family)
VATKKKHDIWMPLYIGDYIAATMTLSTEQHGAYLLLLMAAWKDGGKLPNDPEQLAQVTRLSPKKWALHERILQRFFIVTEDFWIHDRVREESERARDKVAKKASAGAVGAANKWGLSDAPDHHAKRSERLTNARRLASHTKEEWNALVEICEYRCVRCNTEPEAGVCKDHIKPIYQGGSDGVENLQPLCKSCNSAKGSDTTDHRRPDWLERLAERLAKRLTNAKEDA